MLLRSSISIPRAMLNQHCQLSSKLRTFSSISDDGEKAPKIAEKVMKKEPKKSSKEDSKGVNKKQQLDILQQFYDASEAALRYAMSKPIHFT